MFTEIPLIRQDAELHPSLFLWYGAVPGAALKSWIATRNLRVPGDLRELWQSFGGGNLFESEEILAPFGAATDAPQFDDRNKHHHANGLSPFMFVFHEGSWLSAVRGIEPVYVTLDERTYGTTAQFDSLDHWYAGSLRDEFADRYGLKRTRHTSAMRQRAREIQQSIRQVLLHEWDPIGVAGIPEAQDEYDSYVGGVYRLLALGASDEQIAEHLWEIETVTMGLPAIERSRLHPVVQKLRTIDVRL